MAEYGIYVRRIVYVACPSLEGEDVGNVGGGIRRLLQRLPRRPLQETHAHFIIVVIMMSMSMIHVY